jgi:hypothetical protein
MSMNLEKEVEGVVVWAPADAVVIKSLLTCPITELLEKSEDGVRR